MYRPYPNGSYPHFPTQSWYPPGEATIESPPSMQQNSANATDVFVALTNKSVEDLRSLLSNKDEYTSFLQSLDSVKQINSVWNELQKRNVELAKENLEKESEIFELRNQCTIIRTTELAAAQERFKEVQRHEKEVRAVYSPAVLLERLQDVASKVDDESENMYQLLLSGNMNLVEFLSEYRKKRCLYHKRVLTRLAAKTSVLAPG